VGDVHDHQPNDVPPSEGFVRHPIDATVHEVAHLREVADEGESAATPAILAGAALAFVASLAAILILLVFTIAHFA
jgi:hypothetical protein